MKDNSKRHNMTIKATGTYEELYSILQWVKEELEKSKGADSEFYDLRVAGNNGARGSFDLRE